jgi:hypothetical protein
LTAYQISTIFIKNDKSFFGLSAIFLTANAVVMILITFINSGITGTSIGEIVAQLPEGPPLDIKRPVNYDDEINECYKNNDYLPTQNEIFEVFTINRVTKKKKMLGPFEGGIAKLMAGLSKTKRIILTVILYILAVAILLAYALIDYYTRDKSRLGDITMLAVIASDVIMYLYANSEIVSTPAEISLHIVLFRICLFALGGNYWIYGYCLLYLYFGSYLAYHIALIRFPFMDEIIEKELEQLDEHDEARNKFNIAKTPEFLLFLSTLLFGILLSVMEIVKPNDVPLKDYKIETENFEFWVYGLFALLGVLLIFFIILVYRIFIRKRNGIDGKVYFYLHYKNLDLFWGFLIGLYGLLSILTLLLYWVTDEERYLIVGFIAPLAIGLLFNSFFKFALNDFKYAQDIKELNRVIEKHNEKIDRIKDEIKKFKRNVASKTGTNIKNVELSPEDIEEMSKKKLEYKPKLSTMDKKGSGRKKKLTDEVSEEEKDHKNEEDEEHLDEKDYDIEDEIEEGGSEDSKDGENVPGTNRRPGEAMGNEIPQSHGILFQKDMTLNNANLFGRAASVKLHDDEISYDGDYTSHQKATKRIKKIKDWRKDTNPLFAFFSGKLRPNDYHVYISFFSAVSLIIFMGFIICMVRWSVEGISWTMAFLYFFFTYGIMIRPLACDGELHKPETVVYVMTLVLFFIWGFVDFAIRFDFDPDEDNEGHYFLVWYIMLIPFVGILTTGLYKWYDKKWKFGKFVIISLTGATIQGIGLLVCCYVFIGPVSGSIILGIVVAVCYIAFMIFIYKRNKGYLPRPWLIANAIILSLVAIVTFIVSLAVDDFVVFFGWSISYGIFALMVFAYGFINLAKDLINAESEPIYFSPWVFPVFKYVAKKNDIQLRNTPTAFVFLSFALAMAWSFQCAVWIEPVSTGVSVSCLVEVLFLVFILYLSSFTPAMLEDIKMNLDQLLVKRAWLEAKNDFLQTKNIETPD